MLRYLTSFKLSEPWIGLLGLLSSVMSIYDIWPETETPVLAQPLTTPMTKPNGKTTEASARDEDNDLPTENTND